MNKEYLIYKLSDEVKNSCKIDKEAFKSLLVGMAVDERVGDEVDALLGISAPWKHIRRSHRYYGCR